MPTYDFRTPRLFVDVPLDAGLRVELDRSHANYLMNVLRLSPSSPILIFNGREGEWRAALVPEAGKRVALNVLEQTRPQTVAADLHYLFAPLKHARLDYMAQKAVEMGASRLGPVYTRHTQPQRVNLPRMRANAIEAAEQCGILSVPEVAEPVDLERLIATWPPERLLVFCDERADTADPLALLSGAGATGLRPPPLAVLIGPEGGFAEEERTALLGLSNVVRLPLGPRILRADTAAVAALALVQAALGDWRGAD